MLRGLNIPFGGNRNNTTIDWNNTFWSFYGRCSIIRAVHIAGYISLIFAVCEIIQILWLLKFTKSTHALTCSIVILIGQCLRIFALTYWISTAKNQNSKSHTTTIICVAGSSLAIIIFVVLIIFSGFNGIYKNTKQEISKLLDIILVTGLVDVIFSLGYAAFIAQYFMNYSNAMRQNNEVRMNDWADRDNEKYKRVEETIPSNV